MPTLHDKDALPGYLMARAAMHRKIDNTPEIEWKADGSMEKRSDALRRLQAANETVEETHALLPYGRGNVTEDNKRTLYESSRREEAAPHLFDENSQKGDPQQRWPAVFRFVKAAQCGGSAPIATHLHATKLEEPYRVSTERYGMEYDPRSTFHPDFLHAAGKALHGQSGHPSSEGKSMPPRLAQEIQAVGVALSLNEGPSPAADAGEYTAASTPSGKIRNALAQAPGIIESAKRHFPPQDPYAAGSSRMPLARPWSRERRARGCLAAA